jgi:hypothetical protein
MKRYLIWLLLAAIPAISQDHSFERTLGHAIHRQYQQQGKNITVVFVENLLADDNALFRGYTLLMGIQTGAAQDLIVPKGQKPAFYMLTPETQNMTMYGVFEQDANLIWDTEYDPRVLLAPPWKPFHCQLTVLSSTEVMFVSFIVNGTDYACAINL